MSKGRSSSRCLNAYLRRLAGACIGAGLQVDVAWLPTWANPSDCPSRGKPLAERERPKPLLPPLEALAVLPSKPEEQVMRRLRAPAATGVEEVLGEPGPETVTRAVGPNLAVGEDSFDEWTRPPGLELECCAA